MITYKNLSLTFFLMLGFTSFGFAQSSVNFDLRKQAGLAYKKGEVIKAIEILNLALKNDSTDALAFFNLANVYLSVPSRERAIKNFNRSIKLNPLNINLILKQFIYYSGLSNKLKKISQIFLPKTSIGDSLSDSTFAALVQQ